MTDRSDCGTCERCSKPVNLQHDPPCPHGVCVCDTCEKPDACQQCARLDAMEKGAQAAEGIGPYPEDDPLFIPANQERDHAYWTTELDAHTESVRRYYKKDPA